MDWRQFETLVGEAFRRQGYKVKEVGFSGADGGIDLILQKDGATTLVQCKRWRTKWVDVRLVREMYGLLVHHRADALKIVAIGHYTDDAQRFVSGKPIELISGHALLAMVRESQSITPRAVETRKRA
nr:restriction endonuclease [Dyella sp. 2HG41-7]